MVTPKSPKGWHKTRSCCFFLAVKFNLCRKKYARKFFLCENVQRQCCRYIITLTNGWIAGDVPIYFLYNICAQSDLRLQKTLISTDFAYRNSAGAVRES